MDTTIKISSNVKSMLDKMKIFERETYNEVILNMVENNLEINEKTKKDLEQARKSKNWVSHEEVKKRFGL